MNRSTQWPVIGLLLAAACDAPAPGEPNFTWIEATEPITLGAPLFGLDAARDGGLIAAVASAGVVRVRGNQADLIAQLPGVNDVAALGAGPIFAITGGATDPSQILPTSRKLFTVAPGTTRQIADLWAFEQTVNPDGFWHTGLNEIESNPFDVAVLRGHTVLIADAAANSILIVNARGQVDWVAALTPVTAGGPEPVPTSIAIGPDGAYYVGELTGFPEFGALSRAPATPFVRARTAQSSHRDLLP
jgi:hypothetical protein